VPLACVLGASIRLDELLLKRDRSLIDQSLHARLGGTGTVKVKRSYRGVTHGVQGAYTAAPPGTVWMSPRARDRVR